LAKPNTRPPKFTPRTMSGDPMLDALFAEYRRKGMTLDKIGEAASLTGSTLNSLLKERCVVPKFQTVRKLADGAGVRMVLITEDGRAIDPYASKE
jgi:transcriptional regulator with XRE-family HTH domain